MSTSTNTNPSRFLDFLKPRKNEAILKLRNSIVALTVLFILTNLSPLPSLWVSIWLLWGILTGEKKADMGYGSWSLCLAQGIICTALLLTVLQASIALKYPRESHPPLASSARSLHPSSTPVSQKKVKFKNFSPSPTPQKQKPFPLSSSYASSPVSTPSRTLNYTLPSTALPFNTSMNSSLSTSIPPSPSPLLSSPLAAYRGKHSQSIGHALNGSFLEKISRDEDSDEE